MKRLKQIGLGLLGLLFLGIAAAWWVLRASLPLLDGSLALAGLAGPVSVDRDHAGVVTLRADNRVDLARALGFVHGQDRFFQMDLSRRLSAGELSALFGPATLKTDMGNRIHRFRAVAQRKCAQMSADEQKLLQAYADGVNQGLNSLGAWPFEYWLLGVEPKSWLPEDSMLVLFSMFLDLHDGSGEREALRVAIKEFYPAGLAGFLQPAGGPWDAPLMGEAAQAPAVPGPEVLDLRVLSASVPVPATTGLVGLEQQSMEIPGLLLYCLNPA